MAFLLLLVAAGALALAIAAGRRDRDRRRAAAATVRMTIDDEGVARELADGRREAVSWNELVEVRYVVLPRGPWDVRGRLILAGPGERGCIVPIDVAEERGLVAALGRLPGFDFAAFAILVDEDRPGTTIVWARSTRP